ncbi:MAG: hypothetical protein ACMXYC_01385 [Candidatus Woesearchaeota archaeon]
MGYINNHHTNRDFSRVDSRFRGQLGKEILDRWKITPNVVVCDIACGTHAHAITELVNIFPELIGYGIDYDLQKISLNPKLRLIKSDIFEQPLIAKVDVAYCAFIIDTESSQQIDNETRIDLIYSIALSLKSRGIGYLDERLYSARPQTVKVLENMVDEKYTDFSAQYRLKNNPEIIGRGNFLKIYNCK